MSHCNPSEAQNAPENVRKDKILLVGSPNVGKSLLFNRITGSYVVVSNYPGTTVTMDRGYFHHGVESFEVIDTPGMYSMFPITEEERISKLMLLESEPHVVVNVLEAKNLRRMLPLTLQLIEAGLPVILVINMMDEAEKLGLKINSGLLEKELGIPVFKASAMTGQGIEELKKALPYQPPLSEFSVAYSKNLEAAVEGISSSLSADYTISKRTVALSLLQNDEDVLDAVGEREGPETVSSATSAINKALKGSNFPMNYTVKKEVQRKADSIAMPAVRGPGDKSPRVKSVGKDSWKERLSLLMIRPVTGIPILLAILYIFFYKFVGGFGAGYLVDLIEGTLFEGYINPAVTSFVNTNLANVHARNLIVGDYGIVTLGLTYAVAIVLPIVGSFFLVFSIIEDSGYLPRLALLIDRMFKKIGLTGRAVIPMVLGLGCDTMATIVTRTQETKRERIISTLLLALAIPCSAQLGVILGILSVNPLALIIWLFVILLVFVTVGYLASKIVPGEPPSFYMELPPLRMPKVGNVLTKTYSRMVWYFKEILPIFLLVSVVIWALDLVGVFAAIIGALSPLVNALGLPDSTSQIFLFGFFRRDYGAAGLYDIQNALTGVQLLVATVTLTLFVPCVAQFLVMIKERGIRTAFIIFGFTSVLAFFVGFLLNLLLTGLGVTL